MANTNSAAACDETVDILGIAVTSGDPNAIINELDQNIAERRPTRVAFLNTNLATVASADPTTKQALSSFMVLNDGAGVSLARKVLHGKGFAHNLNGTDFVPLFLDMTSHDLRIYLLGSAPDVLSQAIHVIGDRWPRHRVVGAKDGYWPRTQDNEITSTVAASKPDIVLVAMGNPLQEQWIAENIPQVCPCAVGVGAWFDFVTGKFRRAPRWMRAARMEWAYRLALEPRRLWRRYLVGNTAFLAHVFTERQRRQRLQVHALRGIRYANSMFKRSLDVTISAAALLLLSPVLGGIAICVRTSSPGPVIYRQLRSGRYSRPFEILKFRTMFEETTHIEANIRQVTRSDPRVTPIGRLLRRTSLDELPQLFNVLKGDMSLVGPRPHAVTHDAAFAQILPEYPKRFAVKPGISGLAQVNGSRGETADAAAIARRLKYDLAYVRTASPAVDVAILARTVVEVVGSRTAY